MIFTKGSIADTASVTREQELVVDGTQLFLSSLEDVRMLSLLPAPRLQAITTMGG